MKVHTFFSEIPGIKKDQLLLDLWHKSWRAFGWETVQLSEADARANYPGSVSFMMASEELRRGPCPEGYNLATHLRWAAHPGGLIVDYDVICNGFTQEMLDHEISQSGTQKPIFLNACACCCAVYCDSAEPLMDVILEHAQYHDTPRNKDWPGELSFVCHDQAIFESRPDVWKPATSSYVTEFSKPGWREAPLVHFPNALTPSPRGVVVRMQKLPPLR